MKPASMNIRHAAIEYNAEYPEIVEEISRGDGYECVSVCVKHPYASRHNSGEKYFVSAIPGIYISGSGFSAAGEPVVKSFRSRPSEKAVRKFAADSFGPHAIRFGNR